jgi:spermidine synthase
MFDHKRYAKNQQLDRVTEDKFDRMADVLPEGKQGVAVIDHFAMNKMDVLASLNTHYEDFVPEGTYARLRVNGELMMTDSPMEKRTNLEIVEKARGRVLIAGLGIGMILRTIMRKPEVTHITVLEKYQDVVDLVLPQFASSSLLVSGYERNGHNHIQIAGAKLEVIVADVFQWEPTDTTKYNTIYFDIWPNSLVDFLPEMDALYKRYRPLLAKGGWMDSWTYKQLKQKQAEDIKFRKELPGLLDRHRNDCAPEVLGARLQRLLAHEKLSDDNKRIIREWAEKNGVNLTP